MYKLIALDMDGTLLDDEQKVSESNRGWIKQASNAGIYVCLSTGRGIQSVRPYLDELGLSTPMVIVNGSEVWENPESVWVRHTVEPVLIRQLHELGRKQDAWFWGYTTEGIFNKDAWVDRTIDDYTWLKFGIQTERADVLAAIRAEIDSWNRFEITNSHPSNLELNPQGISKATGLQEICSRLGLSMSQVVAVGDSLNDIAMIREAGLGVAMGNAQETVKQAADQVTLTNNEDGVAAVIQSVLAL